MAAITGVSVGRAALGTAAGVGVDDDVHVALAVQQHLARAVPRHRAEAHHLQHLAQRLRLAGGVLDELDAVQAQRVGQLADGFAVGVSMACACSFKFRRTRRPGQQAPEVRVHARRVGPRPVNSSKAPTAWPTAMRAAVHRAAERAPLSAARSRAGSKRPRTPTARGAAARRPAAGRAACPCRWAWRGSGRWRRAARRRDRRRRSRGRPVQRFQLRASWPGASVSLSTSISRCAPRRSTAWAMAEPAPPAPSSTTRHRSACGSAR